MKNGAIGRISAPFNSQEKISIDDDAITAHERAPGVGVGGRLDTAT